MSALRPLSWLYGTGTALRNRLFDLGLLQSRSFPIPVICVGNLAVGGTGKTPHVEYIAHLLSTKGHDVGILSRGYGRKTKGFRIVEKTSTAAETGDEPLQMKLKMPALKVCVDEDRCHGIERMLSLYSTLEVIVLDDAFQHRYVKAGLNILLTDYARPYSIDKLMPEGRLRESPEGAARADIVIVTKVPHSTTEADRKTVGRTLQLLPGQRLFFTGFRYGPLIPNMRPLNWQTAHHVSARMADILLITGIARPAALIRRLSKNGNRVTHLQFADHHVFSTNDAHRINEAFNKCLMQARDGAEVIVITTEKDAVRLAQSHELSEKVRAALYVQPVEVDFDIATNQQTTFNKIITDYVDKNKRDSRMD